MTRATDTNHELHEVVVVIPCYGYAHFLPEAVTSVAAQTWPHIDCVIVDPESPDDTRAVAERLIRDHPQLKIRVLEQQNRGLPASRNDGIRSTTAPLVLALDADDRLHPCAVEHMVRPFLLDPGISVVHCAGREFGDRRNPMPAVPVTEASQLHKNRLPYCSMFTRTAFDEVGGYNENMVHGYEDWDLWIGMLERRLRFHAVQEELFFYRKHGRTMLDEALTKDIWLRSRLILNHPGMYRSEQVALAKEVLDLGKQAPGREPDLALRFRIASFYAEVNCPEGALPHCQILLEQEGPHQEPAGLAWLSFVQGYGLLALDRPTDAIAPLQKATEIQPGNASYWRALALALFHGGRPQPGMDALATAMRLQPESAEGRLIRERMHQPVA